VEEKYLLGMVNHQHRTFPFHIKSGSTHQQLNNSTTQQLNNSTHQPINQLTPNEPRSRQNQKEPSKTAGSFGKIYGQKSSLFGLEGTDTKGNRRSPGNLGNHTRPNAKLAI
jgi:hypothetical protein